MKYLMNYQKKTKTKNNQPKKIPNKTFANTGMYYSFKSGKKSEELFEK